MLARKCFALTGIGEDEPDEFRKYKPTKGDKEAHDWQEYQE